MTDRRKICVVTGARSEYGLLSRLMREVANDPALRLQIVVTGMHLSPEFGSTYRQIETDGFAIDEKVEMLLSSDTSVGVTKSLGLGVIGFADAFERLRPDIVVLLGDRFEILAAAQAALIGRIPIAHIHGGETTEGAFDDAIRHAITKMAYWHFATADLYRKRIIQLGESPSHVHNAGAPGLDHIVDLEWLSREQLESYLAFPLGKPLFLITYHPVTLADEHPAAAFGELLTALDGFQEATCIFTYPNADTGGRKIIEEINRWVDVNAKRAIAVSSLGQQRYLSLLKEADVMIGNSSSGLIEAPALKKATVNIGDRQTGRLKATSVIDAAENSNDIAEAIRRALSEPFRQDLPSTISLYGEGNASARIKAVLATAELGYRKSFFSIDHDF